MEYHELVATLPKLVKFITSHKEDRKSPFIDGSPSYGVLRYKCHEFTLLERRNNRGVAFKNWDTLNYELKAERMCIAFTIQPTYDDNGFKGYLAEVTSVFGTWETYKKHLVYLKLLYGGKLI